MNERNIHLYKNTLTKHQNFLKKFSRFPDKSRKAIWLQLLQVPLNHQHFRELTKPYPLLPEHTIDKQVAFIVSAFCRLYPDLGNQWLPGLIYPFVKLFKEDAIAAFQVSLTFVMNWFRPMFQDYPNSSKSIMNFFSRHLRKLQKKVNSFDYPLSSIIQPVLLVALTDILNKDDTMQVFDYLVAHPYSPELYLSIAVTIIAKVEDKLCGLSSIEDIAVCLRKQKKLNIPDIIKESIALAKREDNQLSQIYQKVVFPLSTDRYPVCQFIKKVERAKNKKLEKGQEEEINRLQEKFARLSNLVSENLKDNQVNYVADINKKYDDVEGQLRQYLRQVQEEHRKKWQQIKQLENGYKDTVNGHQRDMQQHYEEELRAIERRGRVERQIQILQKEAENIRQAERDMLKRVEELSLLKKDTLIRENQMLRQEQRLF